jgi:hypothetical protein
LVMARKRWMEKEKPTLFFFFFLMLVKDDDVLAPLFLLRLEIIFSM